MMQMHESVSKRLILAVCLLLLCYISFVKPGLAFGETQKATEADYEMIIMDQLNLLSDDQEEALYEEAKPILEYGNVIVSSVSLGNHDDYEKNAEEVYYQYYKNQPGIHFQIDMGNRKLTLSCSTEMEKLLGSERESIVDNIYTYATDENYYGCVSECFSEVVTILNDGKIAHTMKYIDNGILAFILALMLNFILVFSAGSKKVDTHKLVGAVAGAAVISNTSIKKGKLVKIYSPSSSGSSGGSSSGGGGGGGGGGFSGGSSSHGF